MDMIEPSLDHHCPRPTHSPAAENDLCRGVDFRRDLMTISRRPKYETKSGSEEIQMLQIDLHRGSLSSINREQGSKAGPRSQAPVISLKWTLWQQREIELSRLSLLKGDFCVDFRNNIMDLIFWAPSEPIHIGSDYGE
jgi:hypothetical protein